MKNSSYGTEELADALKSVNLTRTLSPKPTSIPRTLIKSYQVDGIPSDVWVQIFQDRIIFGVSQHQGRIGNWVMCEPTQSETNMKQTHFEVTNLLGARDDTLLNVYCQQLCQRINSDRGSENTLLTVILGISLHKEKGRNPSVFQAILELLSNLYHDALNL